MHSATVANQESGGANATKMARKRYTTEFIEYCTVRGIDLTNPKNITPELLNTYARYLATTTLERAGNSTGTVQNKMAAVRKLLKKRGINLEKLGIDTNVGLGIGPRRRIGTKMPVTDAIFAGAVNWAIAEGEIGLAHCLNLERYLGHRGLEAIMSPSGLLEFAREARQMLDGTLSAVPVLDGTKGGRQRVTMVIAKYAAETLKAIADALSYAEQNNGYLIQGKTQGLKSARARYAKIAAKAGLVGRYSPHSLRYRYVCDKLEELRDAGVSRAEALVLVAAWIGHGPGRGRWVDMVYGRTVTGTFPKTTRRRSQRDALTKIKELIAQFSETPTA